MSYVFYMEMDSGERVEWRGLSLHQARTMHRITEQRIPDNVHAFGWEQTK